MLGNKKTATIYMDTEGIFFVIKSKDDIITGSVPFGPEEIENPQVMQKKLDMELRRLNKQSKVKAFNIVLSEGIKMVKVFKYPNEFKHNSDLILRLNDS